jgi:hypothetical protein
MANKEVPYTTEDRQWDIRINVQTDDYLQTIVENVMLEDKEKGKFKYVLIGGLEIGTRPSNTDYQVRHVHVAVIFHNRASKSSIISNWGIKEGNGYYMVPRNRELPYTGWRDHHTKEFSKCSTDKPDSFIIYENGELPKDQNKRKVVVVRSEAEKKMKTDEIIIDMRGMIETGQDKEAFEKYPRNYMQYGEKIKALISQNRKKFFGKHTDPHVWLYGFAGSGKTAIMNFIYNGYYKKDLQNRFWDLYDETIHSHTMLEDLDANNLEKLGIQFLKTICDEAGFPIDQKYKTPQLTRSTILVTANVDIDTCLNSMEDVKDLENTRQAIKRRFFQIRIDELKRMLGIKMISDYERKILKKEGNEDPAKLFLDWNYRLDCPTGLPLKSPEEYKTLIRDFYFK